MKSVTIIKNGRPTKVEHLESDEIRAAIFSSLTALHASQIQALTERNEFLEDLIAELAVQVYATPPSA